MLEQGCLSRFWAEPTIFFPRTSISCGVGNEKQGLWLRESSAALPLTARHPRPGNGWLDQRARSYRTGAGRAHEKTSSEEATA
jgi:hypothetical protein